jgi:Tol biopolymer transport system component
MDTDRWTRLADWHNAWLASDERERARLRDRLASTEPDLVAEADDLIAAGASLGSFLETPAFVLAAERMAREPALLPSGMDIGPYRIVGLLARGGMGVVYRVRDGRLDRDVALKMLSSAGTVGTVQVDWFLREARLTAAIDHPNVVRVYDVGVFEGQPYMVAELLEGETLRARLNRGPLTVAEARRMALAVTAGLIAAHAAGLVHRDLKPENIFLTRSGVVKILDFGIAKLLPGAPRRQGAPTLTGMLLGTAGYLAPEQIRGESVDGRADLFAVGAIVFEAVTGRRAFSGDGTVEMLHAVLHDPAPDLRHQDQEVPPALAAIVSRLLEKAPADRFQSAVDLRWALEQADGMPGAAAALPDRARPAASPGGRTMRWAMVPAGLLAIAALGAWLLGGRPAEIAAGALTRFSVDLPDGTGLAAAPAVSPHGRSICWVAADDEGRTRLYVRDLSSVDTTVIPGTDEAEQPFWSPDGTAIGFFAGGRLKKVAIDGGTPVVLADAPAPRGGAWSQAGVIVFQPLYRDSPLMRVSDQGGSVEPVTALNRAEDETTHVWPAFLPDGTHFTYVVRSTRDARRGVYIGRLAGDPQPSSGPLFASDSGAVYVPLGDGRRGALLSVAHGRVEVRPFDPERLLLLEDARTIDVGAVASSPHHAALLSASSGVLVHGTAPIPYGFHYASVGRDGSDLRIEAERVLGGFPRLSPDGRQLAHVRVDILQGNPDIWLDDLDRGTRLRLTTSSDLDVMPVWSPDGREIAFRSGRLLAPAIGVAAADGGRLSRTLPCPESPCEPTDWSPDGRFLVVTVRSQDVWTVPLDAGGTDGPPRRLLAEAFVERDARLSPDQRWVAYVSAESGRPEVLVRSLAGPTPRFVVSSGGGDQPVWRRDGAELFFAGPGGQLFAVPIRPDGTSLRFGPAAPLPVPALGERHWGTIYEVSPDGRRIYFPHAGNQRRPREFGVVLGWTALAR